MKPRVQLSLSLFLLAISAVSTPAARADDGSDKPGEAMAVVAARLVEVLPADQKQKLLYKYDDQERLN